MFALNTIKSCWFCLFFFFESDNFHFVCLGHRPSSRANEPMKSLQMLKLSFKLFTICHKSGSESGSKFEIPDFRILKHDNFT